METRAITVYSTRTNSKTVIMTAATTLGELKRDLDQHGIDYTDMTFYEGLTKTELKTDDSVLPHDVMFKGQITNELAFMLTNMDKKIKSGAMSRKEAYDAIKALNLQGRCLEEFGRNYTQVATNFLEELIERACPAVAAAPAPVETEVERTCSKMPEIPSDTVQSDSRTAIRVLATAVYQKGIIALAELQEIYRLLDEDCSLIPEKPAGYSQKELDSMFDFI